MDILTEQLPVLARIQNKVKWFFQEKFKNVTDKTGEVYQCCIDGVGVIADDLYSSGKEELLNCIIINSLKPRMLKGAMTIYTSRSNEYKIISDYIGSSFIYFYKDKDKELYSSSLKSLINALNVIGIYPKKSLAFQACKNTFGSGNFGLSSYEDVFILSENSMVIATDHAIKVVNFSVDQDFLNNNLNYIECLNLAKTDLVSNAKAVLNSSYDTKLTHLTGGFDSRLVVSVFDYLNELDKIELNCLGVAGSIDYDNAYRVAAELNADFSNRANYYSKSEPFDFEEKYLWEIDATDGMISNNPFHKGLSYNKDFLILSGGYGELLRTFYKVDSYNLSFIEAANYLGKFFDKRGNERSFLNRDVLLDLRDKTCLFLQEAILKGYTLLQAMELFFITTRNRYYIGTITKVSSKFTSRFDLLYSPYMFTLGFSVLDQDRKKAVPLFDLMNMFSKRLTRYPFGTVAWDKNILKERDFSIQPFNNNLIPKVLKFPVEKNNMWMPKIQAESRRKAKEMRAAVWQVEIYPLIQKRCLEIIEEHGNHFFQSYDRTRIMRLLSNELTHRGAIRSVLQLYSCLMALYISC